MPEVTQTIVELCSHPTYTDLWRFRISVDRVCNHCHAELDDSGNWRGGRTRAEVKQLEDLLQKAK
jgi:hypothetical protein